MKIPAPTSLSVAVNRLLDSGAFLAFVQVPCKTRSGFFRFVRNNRNVHAGGFDWVAAAMSIQWPEQDSLGTLGTLGLTISNVSRRPLAEVEINGELIGQVATVFLTHTDCLDDLMTLSLRLRHRVTNVTANEAALKATCAHEATGLVFPAGTITRAVFPGLSALSS